MDHRFREVGVRHALAERAGFCSEMETEMNTSNFDDREGLNLREIVHETRRILFRHRKRMLCFFCGTMALVVLGLIVCPRKYISEAKLFVRVGRESIGLDPTATTGQTLPLHESRENEITSVLDILGSRIVLEGVVNQLGPGMILDGVSDSEEELTRYSSPRELSRGELLRREKAIRQLHSDIKKVHTKKSNVLGISYRDRSPELAQQILQAFVDQFRAIHIGANRTSGSFGFFETQVALLREQFEKASRELNTAKDVIHAVSVDQRRASLQDHLSSVETAQLITKAELDATEASVRGLQQTLDNLPKKTLTQEVTGFPDDAIGTTRKRLYDLELREEELLTQFTENHPLVIAVQRQSDVARGILENRATSGSQATNADNPAYQQLRLKKLEQESGAIALRAKLATLNSQFTELKTQLKALNARETSIVELQQRVDLLRNNYGKYSEKLEQARIDQALEHEHISNVNVVQPPSFVAKPVSPKKALTLIIGFLFGSAGAVCLAFVSEYLVDPSSPRSPTLAPARAETTQVEEMEFHPLENAEDAVTRVEQLVEQASI